jgi:hypothetical protein
VAIQPNVCIHGDGELRRIPAGRNAAGLGQSWDLTKETPAYTNHTLVPEALEKCPAAWFEVLRPEHLESRARGMARRSKKRARRRHKRLIKYGEFGKFWSDWTIAQDAGEIGKGRRAESSRRAGNTGCREYADFISEGDRKEHQRMWPQR